VDPHAPVSYLDLSVAYILKEQYKEASQVARRAADLDRVDSRGSFLLGASLVLDGTFTAGAERGLTKAAGTWAEALFWLAVGLAQRHDFAKARFN
jgi:Flp pilus assembly protein TadD